MFLLFGVHKISTLAERSRDIKIKKIVERKISFQYYFEKMFEFYRIEGAE